MELLGIAVGNIGMPYNDFCAVTPEEFGYIYNAYNEQQQEQYKDNWERMRMLAYICIQPYAKKGLTPHKLLPLQWDNEDKLGATHRETEILGQQDALNRLKKVMKREKL